MLDFSRFECITFDCYGTLIDWESGILRALQPIFDRHGIELAREQILAHYRRLEPAEQRRPYRAYREILKAVVLGCGDTLSFRPSLEELESLPNSLPGWQPFPDTVDALRRLKSRFKLGIISNTDDDLFAGSAQRLQVPFDWVTTAQQAQCYKPGHAIFYLALNKMGIPKEKILHAAESRFHDIAPANELGLSNVWVNRSRGKAGATQESQAKPNLEVSDLKTLADLALGA